MTTIAEYRTAPGSSTIKMNQRATLASGDHAASRATVQTVGEQRHMTRAHRGLALRIAAALCLDRNDVDAAYSGRLAE